MSETSVFQAGWDRRLTALTWACSAAVLAAALLVAWVGLSRVDAGLPRALIVSGAALPLVALGCAALLAPRGYALDGKVLRIERRLGSLEIPLARVRAVEPLPAERLRGSLRLLGSEGFFGYFGRFRNRDLGHYRMYATRSDGYVLVEAEVPIVLTPDRPAEFVAALRRHLSVPPPPRA